MTKKIQAKVKNPKIYREEDMGETHLACQKRIEEEGGKATCCYCNPHEGCVYQLIEEGAKDFAKRFTPVMKKNERRII